MNRPAAWGLLVGAVLSACTLEPAPVEIASSPTPTPPGVRAEYPARLEGVVTGLPEAAWAAGGAYRTQAYRGEPIAGALVYLMTPDERLYLDAAGQAVMTTTNDRGRYDLPASVNQPLVVTALLPQNRRLAGYTLLSAPGTVSLDVSLASTYVTEFLRDRARRNAKALSDFDLAKLADATRLTWAAIDTGALPATADISVGGIPNLVADYLVGLASRSRGLSDAWTDIVGSRPLAVTRLDDLTLPGHFATSVAVNGPDVYVASFNDTGVRVHKDGDATPLYQGLASAGLIRIDGITVAPDGNLYFVEKEDRYLGGAVDRSGATPSIRLFTYSPAARSVEERRLVLPSEIGPYLADRSAESQVEPFDLDFQAGWLYVGDYQTGLIYRFEATSSFYWPGEVFAGRVEQGRPLRGYSGGDRRQARFGPHTHLQWRDGALYVTDTENSVLRSLRPDGTLEIVAGKPGQRGFAGDGGPPGEALLDYPKGFLWDKAGRLYLVDGDNGRIRLIEEGRIRTVCGGGTRSAGQGDPRDVAFGMLTDVVMDMSGNLLFVDWGSGKVWKLWLQFGL